MSVRISDWFFKELQRLAKLETKLDKNEDYADSQNFGDTYEYGTEDGYTYLARELIEDIKNTEQDSDLD